MPCHTVSFQAETCIHLVHKQHSFGERKHRKLNLDGWMDKTYFPSLHSPRKYNQNARATRSHLILSSIPLHHCRGTVPIKQATHLAGRAREHQKVVWREAPSTSDGLKSMAVKNTGPSHPPPMALGLVRSALLNQDPFLQGRKSTNAETQTIHEQILFC